MDIKQEGTFEDLPFTENLVFYFINQQSCNISCKKLFEKMVFLRSGNLKELFLVYQKIKQDYQISKEVAIKVFINRIPGMKKNQFGKIESNVKASIGIFSEYDKRNKDYKVQ